MPTEPVLQIFGSPPDTVPARDPTAKIRCGPENLKLQTIARLANRREHPREFANKRAPAQKFPWKQRERSQKPRRAARSQSRCDRQMTALRCPSASAPLADPALPTPRES